jgi:hypothetical protein
MPFMSTCETWLESYSQVALSQGREQNKCSIQKALLLNLSTPSTITHETWKFMYKKSQSIHVLFYWLCVIHSFYIKKNSHIYVYTRKIFLVDFSLGKFALQNRLGPKLQMMVLTFYYLKGLGLGFRVQLGLGPLYTTGRDQEHENSEIIYVGAMVVKCNIKCLYWGTLTFKNLNSHGFLSSLFNQFHVRLIMPISNRWAWHEVHSTMKHYPKCI